MAWRGVTSDMSNKRKKTRQADTRSEQNIVTGFHLLNHFISTDCTVRTKYHINNMVMQQTSEGGSREQRLFRARSVDRSVGRDGKQLSLMPFFLFSFFFMMKKVNAGYLEKQGDTLKERIVKPSLQATQLSPIPTPSLNSVLKPEMLGPRVLLR